MIYSCNFSSFVIRIFTNTRWIRLRRGSLLRAGLRTYMRVSACLPTYLVHRFSPVFTTKMRTHVSDSVARQARHGTAQLGSAQPDCAVQVYSAVSTSGRGKGVPRRSYTHATRRRRSMAKKKEDLRKVALCRSLVRGIDLCLKSLIAFGYPL